MPATRRVLLKLSGEALQDQGGRGVQPTALKWIANEIAKAHKNVQLALVVGGGNIWRGARDGGGAIQRVTSDNMGMLATIINALALQGALENLGVQTRVLTSIEIPSLAELFIRRRAIRHLEKGRIVIFAGGTGNPYFTTDTTAALRSSEIEATLLLKATNVDGVYSADPKKYPNAKPLKKISHLQAIKKQLKIMDTSALTLCMENRIPIHVFNLRKKDNIKKAVMGKSIGTKII
jgi:uridylate kinase